MTDPHERATSAASACPDLDTLAEYHAGALDADQSARIAAHVATDARCQQTLAALDATVAQLRSVPAVTMPEHLARRLSAALAAEAGHGEPLQQTPSRSHLNAVPHQQPGRPQTGPMTAPTPAQSEHGRGGNVADLSAAREKKAGRGKIFLAAAAAAVIVGGGAVFATQGGDDTDGNIQADNTSQSQQFEETPSEGQGSEPGGGNAALGFGSPSDVLDKGAIVDDTVDPEVAGEMAETQKRNQCVAAIPQRPVAPPEAVQQGEYDGTEAYAFIFGTDDPQVVEMIIVEADDCTNILDRSTGPR